MSDPLSMSLDDIIKQKKTKKVQVLGIRGKTNGAPRGRGGKVKTSSPVGRSSGNFKGKSTTVSNGPYHHRQSLRNKKTSSSFSPKRRAGGGGSGRIYVNSPKKSTISNWQRNPPGGVRLGPKRRQQNRGTGRPFPFQPQYQYQPVFTLPRSQRGIPVVNRGAPSFRSVRNANWQGKLKFAQKSVYRARQMLIRTRILQNNRNRGQGQYFGTGRILVGKYGLLTTQRQNLVQRQTMMQRKIQRARQIRERRQSGRMDSIVFNNTRGRRQQRGFRNQNAAESWILPTPSAQVSRNYTRPRHSGGTEYLDSDDGWIPPLMTVRNSEHDIRVEQQTRSRPPSFGLDPNIQRKIQYIQQQGKRNRNTEPSHSRNSARYMPVEDEATDFQPTIISSRMSLSDRFKKFMN